MRILAPVLVVLALLALIASSALFTVDQRQNAMVVQFGQVKEVVTKAGRDQSPVYSYLGATGHLPAWNFAKYVVGKDGRVLAFFPSDVTPEDAALRRAIADALKMN